jgi:hypothetical protein
MSGQRREQRWAVQIRLVEDPCWVMPKTLSGYTERRDARTAAQNEATKPGIVEAREVPQPFTVWGCQCEHEDHFKAADAHTYGAGYTGLLVEAVTPHGKFYVCNNCAADHYAEYCVKSEVGNA